MPSTYTDNNGIEKIGSGEQAGTWDVTTNLNFDLIDQSLDGQTTVNLSTAGTSGSPNTLSITDGAVSDGRYRYIEFTDGGDLGSNAYVQLTPNNAQKLAWIKNSLSNSRTILLFQGTYDTGRDYELASGETRLLIFDGAGATATVSVMPLISTSLSTGATGVDLSLTGDLSVTGDVGIGTASPQDEIHIVATNPRVRLDDGTNTAGIGEDGFGNLILDADTGNVAGSSLIQFKIDNSEVARLTSTGRLGIGTNSPSQELELASTGPGIRLTDTDDSTYNEIRSNSTTLVVASDVGNLGAGSNIRFDVDGSEKARLDENGNLGIGGTPSVSLDVKSRTDALALPTGTTAQRPTPVEGYLRYNSTLADVEAYVSGAWGALRGGGYFQGENGNVGGTGNKGDIFRTHEQTLNTNVTIAGTDNSICAGPLTVASGTTLTISSGGNLVIA